jgi:hypothetical protein
MSQYGVYLIVLANLWVFSIREMQSTLVVFLNWAYFFIIDDWAIVTEYPRTLKGRTLPAHNWRIHGFNALVIGLLLIMIVQTFTWIGITLSITLIAQFLFWRYLLMAETLPPIRLPNMVRPIFASERVKEAIRIASWILPIANLLGLIWYVLRGQL